jgi:hypothetical protein
MDYETYCEEELTIEEARIELEKHDCTVEEFTADYGIKESYLGAEVLEFLGY